MSQTSFYQSSKSLGVLAVALSVTLVSACADQAPAPSPSAEQTLPAANADYVIGAGDQLQVFVWKSPELSTSIHVRPDGKISLPLIDDIQAAGQTPTELGHVIRERLADYVQDPVVTVMPVSFVGTFDHQIRVIGEATKPRAFAYRADMTVLDVMIEVGGLTDFAAGNRAVIVRRVNGRQTTLPVRLQSLVQDGDVSANVPMRAGDILIIPQSWY